MRVLLVALGVWLVTSAAVAQIPPDGTPILEVDVRGTQRTDPDRIRRVMELKPGTPWTLDAQRRDLRAVSDLGVYNPLTLLIAAESVPGGARVVVEVRENPLVASITFVGNTSYSGERLRRELDFREGEIMPLGARSTTSRSIREFYARGGFKSAEVRVRTDPADDPDSVNVLIVINENERIRIRSLKIDGNRHFSDFRIRQWATNSGGFLFFRNYYDDRAMDDDLRMIERRYRAAGFLDATARRGEYEVDERRNTVSPLIVVREGPRYRVEDIRITGHTLFLDDEVRRPFDLLPGRRYNETRLDDAIMRLRRLYGDQGYVNARVQARFEKDPETADVVIQVEITENQSITVGEVFVQRDVYDYQFDLSWFEKFIDWMSPGVKEETIRREVRLQPGTTYRAVDEVRTVERLRGLGFLEEVHIRREPTADPRVNDVVVEVREDPSAGYVVATAGVGEVTGATIGVGYVNPNLFGDAKVLRANAVLGRRMQGFSVGYLNRYIRNSQTSFEWSAWRDQANYGEYLQRTWGTWGELGRPLSEDVRGYLRLRFEYVLLSRRDILLLERMDNYGVVAVRPLLVRDRRNSRRWTTQGYLLSGGIEAGYARNTMLKLLHGAEYYRALSRDENWVYAYAHQAGLQPYRQSRVGLTERFFIGGTSTLRGFQPRGVGPKDPGTLFTGIGGSTMLTQRHELRRRFSRLFQARVFLDGGMLEAEPLDFARPRVSTGVGVSFDLGAFVVDLDFARAIVKEPFDKTRFLHFRLRSAF